MYKFGDKEVCDQQVNDAFWQSMKQRLEWCKGAVAEQLSKTGRKKYSRREYDVDSEVESVYAAFLSAYYQPVFIGAVLHATFKQKRCVYYHNFFIAAAPKFFNLSEYLFYHDICGDFFKSFPLFFVIEYERT